MYTNVKVNVSEGQKQKIQNALRTGGPVNIRLSYEDLDGQDVLAFTSTQVNRIAKAYESGKGITIKMSKAQLKHNTTIEGGFFTDACWFGCECNTYVSKDSTSRIRCWCPLWLG